MKECLEDLRSHGERFSIVAPVTVLLRIIEARFGGEPAEAAGLDGVVLCYVPDIED